MLDHPTPLFHQLWHREDDAGTPHRLERRAFGLSGFDHQLNFLGCQGGLDCSAPRETGLGHRDPLLDIKPTSFEVWVREGSGHFIYDVELDRSHLFQVQRVVREHKSELRPFGLLPAAILS